jgi:Glycine cleavage system H protein (lipoate-binding)
MGPSSKNSAVANLPRRAGGRLPLGTVPAESKECIWMSAGVLSYRLCDREFDCEHCLLDMALHGGDSGASASWTPGEWGPSGYRLFPQDRHFSPAHTWVLELGSASVRLGVDALLAWLLSETTSVKLPAPNTWLERGEVAATLFAKGGKLTVPAPISGRVLGRNEAALGCPELVVSAPYGAGWLVDMAVEPGRRNKQFTRLLCGPDMEKLSRSHLHNFHSRTDALLAARPARVGATLADGGNALTDPRAMLGPARYLRLVQELLT